MKIERIATAKLIPYARNARTHSEEQIAQIAASIREFGWTNPVLIDEQDGIIAGHGRVSAARVLNMSPIPCIRLTGLTDAQKRAYVIADNKLALNAGWDEELLRIEMKALHDADFDVSLIGFNEAELRVLTEDLGGDGVDNNIRSERRFLVMIECADEAQQAALFDEMQKRGLTVKVLE